MFLTSFVCAEIVCVVTLLAHLGNYQEQQQQKQQQHQRQHQHLYVFVCEVPLHHKFAFVPLHDTAC